MIHVVLQAPALFRAAQLSKSGIDSLLAKKLLLRHRSNPQGVRGLASMGFLDAMLGAVKGGAGRDYSDLKAGDFPAETAQYALNNEVKAVSKVSFIYVSGHMFAMAFTLAHRRMAMRLLLSEVILSLCIPFKSFFSGYCVAGITWLDSM